MNYIAAANEASLRFHEMHMGMNWNENERNQINESRDQGERCLHICQRIVSVLLCLLKFLLCQSIARLFLFLLAAKRLCGPPPCSAAKHQQHHWTSSPQPCWSPPCEFLSPVLHQAKNRNFRRECWPRSTTLTLAATPSAIVKTTLS